MLFLKKHITKIISLALCLVLLVSIAIICLVQEDSNISDATIRLIDVEQATNGEKVDSLIAKFNEYNSTHTDTSIGFEGEMYASIGEILGFDSLAYQKEDVIKKVKTNYDYSTNTFSMVVSYYSGNTLLERVESEAEPLYDEERDDGYIEFEGERYYFSESFDTNGLNECIAGVDDVAVIGVGAVLVCGVLITLAVTPPSVQQEIVRSVTTIVETVVETVRSFWRWFTSWVKKVFTRTKVVETTTVVTITTPKVKVNEKEYETTRVKAEEREKLPEKAYYLALADPTNDTFYMSISQIDEAIAIAVMMVATPVDCIGKIDYQMILSVYTQNHSDTEPIMSAVGYSPLTPYGRPDWEKGLYHYHSLASAFIYAPSCKNGAKRSPHMFFANFV
ncbi:MAG: hypothetical protein J1F66_02500 [Clostridiales bacterium]|nr:hypothetical protein [Clostridiales bacterium]